MPVTELELEFSRLGVQYYVAGRAAALAGLLPVCGNLFHHAIEAFLKARLSRKHSLKELRQRPFRHNLPALWRAFKNDFPNGALDQFDATVADVDRFERLRYPDAIIREGAAMMLGKFIDARGANLPNRYQVDLSTIDHLVARILEVCSRNPAFFTSGMNAYAQDALTRANPVGEKLLERKRKP